MVHYISPAPLTFEVIDKILSKNYKLALSEDSKKLINDCKAYLDHKIERSAKPLYGITTGFGSLCNQYFQRRPQPITGQPGDVTRL